MNKPEKCFEAIQDTRLTEHSIIHRSTTQQDLSTGRHNLRAQHHHQPRLRMRLRRRWSRLFPFLSRSKRTGEGMGHSGLTNHHVIVGTPRQRNLSLLSCNRNHSHSHAQRISLSVYQMLKVSFVHSCLCPKTPCNAPARRRAAYDLLYMTATNITQETLFT
jgi:hypothetical protein